MLDDGFVDRFNQNGWDLAIVNEEKNYDSMMEFLDTLWTKMNPEGLIVVDYVEFNAPSKQAYNNFCKINNKPVCILKTRYGVGLIQK